MKKCIKFVLSAPKMRTPVVGVGRKTRFADKRRKARCHDKAALRRD